MLNRTKWRVVEEACLPGEEAGRWASARERGATGAVTSCGAGMTGRDTIRLYWELDGGVAPPEGEDLVEENWTSHWRESFHVTPVTRELCLVPAWEELPTGEPAGSPPAQERRREAPASAERREPARRCNLRIDPGMAFGAGDHPTTRLCLRLLQEQHNGAGLPERFLDVGCGTGVLALAAGCLGAVRCDALDIDPFGYAACRRNAALNDLQDKVHPLLLSLDLMDERYPLVAANIVVGQLESLAQMLRRRVAPGGRLLLSGFETENEGRVVASLGWPVVERLEEERWVALALRAPEAAT